MLIAQKTAKEADVRDHILDTIAFLSTVEKLPYAYASFAVLAMDVGDQMVPRVGRLLLPVPSWNRG